MNTLEFDSLYLEFGMQQVLSSIHMKCTTSQIVGLLGRNGSGKSCLIKVVLGTMQAGSKSVRFNGSYLTGNYLKRRIISYLPQTDLLPSFITFSHALKLYNIDAERITTRCPELVQHFAKHPSAVSGGQRRLFEVLLVIYSSSPICILDEPFSGLEPLQVEMVLQILQEEKKHKGFIITDHLHRSIRSIADDLYVLANATTYKIVNDEQLLELGYLANL